MKIYNAIELPVRVVLAVAILSGCGGGTQGSFAPNAGPPAGEMLLRSTARNTPATVVHAPAMRSWMDAASKRRTLLYVSDYAASTIDVYSYPRLVQVGQIVNFIGEPQGLCSDGSGNWYVANSGYVQVLKFAHGGTSPIEAINDPTGFPVSCAVDSKSGNLAVANICNLSPSCEGGGTFLIFKHGVGSPKSYACPNMNRTYFITYDAHGDVFVDGATPGSPGAFVLGELPKGTGTCEAIKLKGTVTFAGDLQWHDGHLLVGDQVAGGPSVVYAYTISGTKGTLVTSTTLTGSSDVAGFIASSRVIIGADYGAGNVGLWSYAGAIDGSITGFENPIGVVLSK